MLGLSAASVLGNRLFKLPLQIPGGVRNSKKWTPKNQSTAQVDSISLTIYHLHFLGCAYFTNCFFGTSSTICSFCQHKSNISFQAFYSKWLNFQIKFYKTSTTIVYKTNVFFTSYQTPSYHLRLYTYNWTLLSPNN